MIAPKKTHAKDEMLVNRATGLWRKPLVLVSRIRKGKTARDKSRK